MDSSVAMIRSGFLNAEERRTLIKLAKDGLAEHRCARRANALLLLDKGWDYQRTAEALYLDDDTIRTWYRLYKDKGINGLSDFGYEGSTGHLDADQQTQLKEWVTKTLPRTTREIGAWIRQNFGIAYQGRSGLIMLMRRFFFFSPILILKVYNF